MTLISGVVAVVFLMFVYSLLRAASWAEESWVDDGCPHPDPEELRGRLIASQQRFRRETDFTRSAANGIDRDGAA